MRRWPVCASKRPRAGWRRGSGQLMRILVTGAGGALGGRIAFLLAKSVDVVAAYRSSPPPAGLQTWRGDLTCPGALADATAGCNAVVHCAAMANADACEQAPRLAEAINVDLARDVARLCSRQGLRLVALSTDLVFDGENAPYAPEHAARPRLVYGQTKLLGEAATLEAAPEAAVARVALVAGRGHGARGSATESILWALRRGETLRLFTDQIRTPIDAESVSRAVLLLVKDHLSGRFHLGGLERLSRFDLGRRVAQRYGLPSSLIVPVLQANSPIGATRPADVSLDCASTRTRLGWEPAPLDAMLEQCRPNRPDAGA